MSDSTPESAPRPRPSSKDLLLWRQICGHGLLISRMAQKTRVAPNVQIDDRMRGQKIAGWNLFAYPVKHSDEIIEQRGLVLTEIGRVGVYRAIDNTVGPLKLEEQLTHTPYIDMPPINGALVFSRDHYPQPTSLAHDMRVELRPQMAVTGVTAIEYALEAFKIHCSTPIES